MIPNPMPTIGSPETLATAIAEITVKTKGVDNVTFTNAPYSPDFD